MPGPSVQPAATGYRGRFAPSPTGPLHLGSLLAAFGGWLLARHAGGEWLVRIEDIDPPREVPGAAAAQLAALAAFGLAGDRPPAWQSRRHALYRAALDRLLAAGHAFACSCSRSALAAQGGIHRRCVAGVPRPHPAIRLRVADGATVAFEDGLQGTVGQDVAAEVGDFVLLRADGCWAYQLAVVVDDADQGITDVVRGADLLDSTPRQILLQRALGLPVPRYLHLPLLLDEDGHKLSKSSAAPPLDPADPLPALRACWSLLGQDPAHVRGCGDVDALLRQARARFDPALLPARLHFRRGDTTTA
ncbi:tRNA glutamyl-Q(34) synthetase GluQRS [Pseudoxanthomonas broegbernensis]|uniref:Glutamyl-Q tRNA(Asp) synthetase n=1 Tax=Pseudoxanthomonas broegbernensis TaxID=83619 RepID=A0A7V8GPV9_9GAMM|nr:tRNA glutamyl-Q(34) synthetase GluQRS [Pseudoxanthomonas broegbernensis]KAF1687952.1 tRNA glutamyl-Q(34) synthetase GluQRS [Pseudoxanthomonas broegbernensis]MBB6064962.1 glutamyl-Q tRNA(Asp) synthetase [Pseudoxanthomonas broegbernensis]